MSRKKTQAYTEEFRREAVRRADQAGNTAASVARELGIHPGQIYNWRRQFTRLSDKQFNSVDGSIIPRPRAKRCANSGVRTTP